MIKSYSEMSIEKYYELKENMTEELEPLDFQVRLISILSDMGEDDVLNLPLDKYAEYVADLDFIYELPKPRNINYVPTIKINNAKYKLLKDVSKMTAGQYIDFQSYLDNGLGVEYILSTVLIPEGKKYGEYDVMPVIEDIRKCLDIQTAISIRFFFHKKLLNTIKRFLICLDLMMRNRRMPKEKQEQMREARKEIRRMLSSLNGSGSIWLTQ